MENRPIFVLLGLLAAASVSADAYTWTDENGLVHYSDRPHPGAKRITLDEFRGSRPQPTARKRASVRPLATEGLTMATPFSYDSLDVASPAAEETLWNIGGTLTVSLTLSPGLQQGHQVRVYFDGKPQMVSGTSFQLENVHRGVHNLQAEVIDETGTLMIRSRPNRFYVQQSSAL